MDYLFQRKYSKSMVMVLPKKAEGTVWLIYENVNGLSNRLYGNKKVEQMKEIHDKMEADIAAYYEHKLNLCHQKNTHGFNQLFRGEEAAIQTIAAHNVHENVSQIQQGGASLLLFGHLTEQLDFKKSGKDPTGLGRWTVMTLQGEGAQTWIVCGYNPCSNSRLNSGTSYQQQRRFFVTEKGDLSCPRKKFLEDLTGLLNQWRDEGDRIVVWMDANENIYSKSIGKTLTHHEGLNMQEVVGKFTGKEIGPTFFWGSKPIDSIWATKDLVITHTCIMPAGFGVGDHRLFIIDFQETSMVGPAPFEIQRFQSRRLNTKASSGSTKRYVTNLEKNISKHCLIEKLGVLHCNFPKRKDFQREFNKLDRMSRDLMLHAKKKCRKIKSG
jgi:hypothetical protein